MQRLTDIFAVVALVAVSFAAPLALLYFDGAIAQLIARI